MFSHISLDALTNVCGGAGSTPAVNWEDIRRRAAPHCPQTVARYTHAPTNRAQAQAIGNACIAEMGPLKADVFGGRKQIQSGIDQAFPPAHR